MILPVFILLWMFKPWSYDGRMPWDEGAYGQRCTYPRSYHMQVLHGQWNRNHLELRRDPSTICISTAAKLHTQHQFGFYSWWCSLILSRRSFLFSGQRGSILQRESLLSQLCNRLRIRLWTQMETSPSSSKIISCRTQHQTIYRSMPRVEQGPY